MNSIALVGQATRLEILRLLWETERSAGEIAAQFDLTFGAISQHLRALEEAGLIKCRQEWRSRYYRVNKAALGPLAAYLESVIKPDTRKRIAKPKRERKNQWPSGWA
jgi:DNA-binding transcriptional ArsR family regulator